MADMEREISKANSVGFVNALILVALLLGIFFVGRYLYGHVQIGWTP